MLDLIHEANNSGTTCWQLLQGLYKKKQLASKQVTSSSRSDTSDTEDNEKVEWNEKLAEIEDEDYFSNVGKFSDQKFQNEFQETYNEWADRIYAEFYNRRREKLPQKKPERLLTSDKVSEFQKTALPPSKPIYPVKKDENVEKYQTLFTTKNTVSTTELPFSTKSTAEEIVSLILKSNQCIEESDQKKVLREAVRKWHPDKFSQMFYDKIKESDMRNVINIVTHVSQTLLVYGR